MLAAFPFTVIPLIIYNVLAFFVTQSWAAPLFSIGMFSGVRWEVTAGDLMVILGLVFLFIEMLRATIARGDAMANHLASVIVLLVYVVEFFVVARAANSTFFILTAIALIDVLGGFSITTKAARRDVTLSHEGY